MISPQQLIQMALNNGNLKDNQIAQSALEKYKNGDIKGLNEIAENLCKEKGINPQEAYQNVLKMVGLK